MALKNRDLSNDVPRETDVDPLVMYSDKELLDLRARIDERLNIGSLEDLDVGHEIMMQLRTLKVMQQEALKDGDAPHGQRAQAAMTVSRLLQDLTKCRTALNNAEISKKLDQLVIECMRDAPEEAKNTFFEQLERLQADLPTLASLMPSIMNHEVEEE